MTIKILQKKIVGIFAKIAIEMSPYSCPDELEFACMLLTVGTFSLSNVRISGARAYIGPEQYFRDYLASMITESIPPVQKWGIPLQKNETKRLCTFPSDSPPYHCIDINVFVQTVINECVQEAENVGE